MSAAASRAATKIVVQTLSHTTGMPSAVTFRESPKKCAQ